MNIKKSVVWYIKKDELQKIINESNSYVEVLKKLNLNPYTGNHRTLVKRIKQDNIFLGQINKNRQEAHKLLTRDKLIDLKDILVENSTYNRGQLKRRLIQENLLEYKCKKCGNVGKWNEQSLVLQLEHLNGINNDNRLENLCLLCPNCHSQSTTFSGRNSSKKGQRYDHYFDLCNCGNKKYKLAKQCKKCYKKTVLLNRKFQITKEELIDLIKNTPIEQIAKNYNVTGTTIRKRAQYYNIDYKELSPFSFTKAGLV